MRITILTIGSRGDVQPFMSLGLGLARAGHQITFGTHRTFEAEVNRLGFRFAPLEGDIRQLVETDNVRDVLDSKENPLQFSRTFVRAAEPLVMQAVKDMLAACQNAEVVVLCGLSFYGGYDVTEKLGLPFIQAVVQPITATGAFSTTLFPPAPGWLPFKSSYNRLTYTLFNNIFWSMIRPPINKARQSILGLGMLPVLPPFKHLVQQGYLLLCGVSPSVIAKPPDWPESHAMCGYWFLDSPTDWQPPTALADFLQAGPPPVYIGFGSMSDRDAAGNTRIALEALKMTGQRGVLLTGWGGFSPADASEQVCVIEYAPHDWLFPRMAAVVHHGGAGTTAAGLRSGAPSIVVPFFGDQPFWGRCVQRLGVGPAPIPRAQLSAQRLAQAIQQAVSDATLRARAAALGALIGAEDGVETAVNLFNSTII